MKYSILSLLLITAPVLAQDISSQPTDSQPSNQYAVTSVGMIDQPTATRSDGNPSQPTAPTPPTPILTTSTPSPVTAPLTPLQPTAPTAPLPMLLTQQVSQPSAATMPMEPQQPTASASPPTPIVLSSADMASPTMPPNANPIASRTIESMQNLSSSLSNLVKVKSN